MTFDYVNSLHSFNVAIQNTQKASKILRLKKCRKMQRLFSVFSPQVTHKIPAEMQVGKIFAGGKLLFTACASSKFASRVLAVKAFLQC